MTNEDLYDQIKQMKQDTREDFRLVFSKLDEINQARFLRKGKEIGIIAGFSVLFTLIINVGIVLIK